VSVVRSLSTANLVRGCVVAALAALVGICCSGCREDDIEEELGRSSAAAIERAYDISEDPLINEWVTTAGQTLVGHSGRQHIPYQFKVIETDLVNAFAAPYGHIYVTSGFLDFADTEDEVWMVLGHEIGHVVNRDGIHSLKRSLLMSILAAIISSKSRAVGEAAGIGLGLLSLRYSRDDEYDADDSGTRLSYLAGYDPNAGLVFFDRLMTDIEKRRPSKWEIYFMTHPPTDRRISRQKERAELDPTSVEALTQIGRGYLRRAENARAIEYLSRAAELAPDSVDLQLALGDAYAGRGQFQQAGAYYAAALRLSPDHDYARTRLAAVEGTQPYELPGIGEDGREHAGELLATSADLQSAAQQTVVNAGTYGGSLAADIDDLVGMVKGMNQRLMSLAEENAEVTEATRSLVVRGNAAITRANESVYVLESVNEDFSAVSAELQELLGIARAQLDAAQRGEGDPEDLRPTRNAITELRRGLSTLDLAMTEAPETIETVRTAQDGAQRTTEVLERLVRTPRPNTLLGDELRTMASQTMQHAVDALHAVNGARHKSVKARGHALLARLNLLGAAASPELQKLLDKQVSHYLLCPPTQVRSVRSEGAGYGEAAVSIAAAKALGASPAHFLVQEGKPVSPVGSALKEGAALDNANVLLKFLAAAMEREKKAYEPEPVT
jgi:predicted Zn-dependent protease